MNQMLPDPPRCDSKMINMTAKDGVPRCRNLSEEMVVVKLGEEEVEKSVCRSHNLTVISMRAAGQDVADLFPDWSKVEESTT